VPNNEEHAQHSYRRYGVFARDLHSWMDEPSQTHGAYHQRFRHDADHPPKWAVEKYGFETAQNIMLDHIYLDKKAQEQSGEIILSWEEKLNPPVHDTLYKLDGIIDKHNAHIESMEVELKIRNPNGANIGVCIPADEFRIYLPKEEFDTRLNERTEENREFDDWVLVNAKQHGWQMRVIELAHTSEPVSTGFKGAIIGFLIWLVGSWIILESAPNIPDTYIVEGSHLVIWLIWTLAMTIITIFHDNDKIQGWLKNSETPLMVEYSNTDNHDEEVEDFLALDLIEENDEIRR